MKRKQLIFFCIYIFFSLTYAKKQEDKIISGNDDLTFTSIDNQREVEVKNFDESGEALFKKDIIIVNNADRNVAFSVYGKTEIDSKKRYLFSIPVNKKQKKYKIVQFLKIINILFLNHNSQLIDIRKYMGKMAI